jgi:NTP pyrophosphatase (non-canonical NTP hydrolase)
MNFNDLAKQINQTAKDKGWHETERSFGEYIALMHTELSEALEEYRHHKPITDIYFNESDLYKPEGVPIELADCIIRIFDFCGQYNIDIQHAIDIKMEYNKMRSYRHGNKKV